MQISKIMHAPAERVEAATPVPEIARRMKEADIGALPVGRDDRLIGMVTDRAENGSAKVCHGSGVIISLRAT